MRHNQLHELGTKIVIAKETCPKITYSTNTAAHRYRLGRFCNACFKYSVETTIEFLASLRMIHGGKVRVAMVRLSQDYGQEAKRTTVLAH